MPDSPEVPIFDSSEDLDLLYLPELPEYEPEGTQLQDIEAGPFGAERASANWDIPPGCIRLDYFQYEEDEEDEEDAEDGEDEERIPTVQYARNVRLLGALIQHTSGPWEAPPAIVKNPAHGYPLRSISIWR